MNCRSMLFGPLASRKISREDGTVNQNYNSLLKSILSVNNSTSCKTSRQLNSSLERNTLVLLFTLKYLNRGGNKLSVLAYHVLSWLVDSNYIHHMITCKRSLFLQSSFLLFQDQLQNSDNALLFMFTMRTNKLPKLLKYSL